MADNQMIKGEVTFKEGFEVEEMFVGEVNRLDVKALYARAMRKSRDESVKAELVVKHPVVVVRMEVGGDVLHPVVVNGMALHEIKDRVVRARDVKYSVYGRKRFQGGLRCKRLHLKGGMFL
ncbi:unnamed protein product, partial [Darwinula stevensoni]